MTVLCGLKKYTQIISLTSFLVEIMSKKKFLTRKWKVTTTTLMIDFIKIYFCKKNQKIARHLAYKDQYCILTAHNLISAIVDIGMTTICAGELHPNYNINLWGHSFSTWGHSFKTSHPLILRGVTRLRLLTPWYAHVCVRIKGKEMLVFPNILARTKWMILIPSQYFPKISCFLCSCQSYRNQLVELPCNSYDLFLSELKEYKKHGNIGWDELTTPFLIEIEAATRCAL